MNLPRYFKPAANLPTAEQAQLPPNVLKEVNQTVARVLQHEESRSSKTSTKRKYTTALTPENRAVIGRYAAENGNATAVKKFTAKLSVGETTV